jgi:Ion channel
MSLESSAEQLVVPRRTSVGFTRREGEKWMQFAERVANEYGILLLLVLATYATASLTRYQGWSAVSITALGSAVAVVGLASSRAQGSLVRASIFLAVACVVFAAVAALSGREGFLAVAALVELFLLLTVVGYVLRAVISETKVGFKTILGAISVYMIFGILFASLYVAVDRLQAGSFFVPAETLKAGDYVFFSFTTLTTTGYGNLVPGGQPGKMLAGVEMLFGQIFLVTLIAGLVSLWRPGHWRGT